MHQLVHQPRDRFTKVYVTQKKGTTKHPLGTTVRTTASLLLQAAAILLAAGLLSAAYHDTASAAAATTPNRLLQHSKSHDTASAAAATTPNRPSYEPRHWTVTIRTTAISMVAVSRCAAAPTPHGSSSRACKDAQLTSPQPVTTTARTKSCPALHHNCEHCLCTSGTCHSTNLLCFTALWCC